MEFEIDPVVREMAQAFVNESKTGRAVLALKAMLERGFVTTDDLNALGYNHPPRAIADVRDQGIPVITESVKNADGRRMARYRLGTAESIRTGQTGRTNFTKKFRNDLLAKYGSIDCITRATHDPRSLQIDHRVPFRVAGDLGLATSDVDAFMLLDAKSQRAKSWACENCENFKATQIVEICNGCFWAFPDTYNHVAMQEQRRTDVVWQNDDVAIHDALKQEAAALEIDLPELLRDLGRSRLKR
jgi:hypothetical protein